jgi:murein DD-endopeptidase MepM/ murein hydrolase activator NlpD
MGDRGTRSARLRVLLVVVVVIAGLGTFLWWRVRKSGSDSFFTVNNGPYAKSPSPSSSPSPSIYAGPLPSPTNQPIATLTPSPADDQSQKVSPLDGNYTGALKLIIPVVGVRPDQLMDTFTDSRSEGRVHDAIDIPAPAGTSVVAAADGEIIKLFQSERGGTTIYQLSTDKKLVFYYAHLQRYADSMTAGKLVSQGEVIAYVGDTGNAGTGNFHLHFSIAVVADPKRYWEGSNINPYPLLHK